MGGCTDLATKSELQALQSKIDGKLDDSEKEGIIKTASVLGGAIAVSTLDPRIAAAMAEFAALAAALKTLAGKVASMAGQIFKLIGGLSTVLGIIGTLATIFQLIRLESQISELRTRLYQTESIAENAVIKGNLAIEKANGAVNEANRATGTANNAKAEANRATSMANQAWATAQDARRDALTAKTQASRAEGQAYTARTEAGAAVLVASTANQKADESIVKANRAIAEANAAKVQANKALDKANAVQAELSQLKASIGQLRAENEQLKRQVGQLDSDVDALRAALADVLNRIGEKESKYIVRQVNQKTIINAGGISDLNGRLVGLESRLGNLEGTTKTSIQNFDGKLAGEIKGIIDGLTGGGGGVLGGGITRDTLTKQQITTLIDQTIKDKTLDDQEVENLVKQGIVSNTLTKEQVEERIKTGISSIPVPNSLNETQVREIASGVVNTKVRDIESMNDAQYRDLTKGIAGITAVLGGLSLPNLDRHFGNVNNQLRTVTNQTSSPAISKAVSSGVCSSTAPGGCMNQNIFQPLRNQGDSLINALGTAASGLNTAILTRMEGVLNTVNRNVGIVKQTTDLTNATVSHPGHGLVKIQDFASKAWEATHADKILSALTTAMVIHNGVMLSNNVLSSVGEAATITLQAMGLKDSTGKDFDVSQLVQTKITQMLTSILGAENYAALTKRIAAYSRIYQASANVLNLVQEIGDSARSVAETTCENTGKIGNALLESGVVYENAYQEMIDRVNPHSKAMLKLERFRNGLETIEQGASAISEISSEVVETQENFQELKQAKEEWKTANDALLETKKIDKEAKKTESKADTEVKKQDFGKNEKDII